MTSVPDVYSAGANMPVSIGPRTKTSARHGGLNGRRLSMPMALSVDMVFSIDSRAGAGKEPWPKCERPYS